MSNFTAFAIVNCECGWIVTLSADETGYCENPKCPNKGVAYKVLVKVVELKVKRGKTQ